MAVQGFCVKCKAMKEIKNPVESVAKNGRPMTKGTCPDCGTTVCRLGAIKK